MEEEGEKASAMAGTVDSTLVLAAGVVARPLSVLNTASSVIRASCSVHHASNSPFQPLSSIPLSPASSLVDLTEQEHNVLGTTFPALPSLQPVLNHAMLQIQAGGVRQWRAEDVVPDRREGCGRVFGGRGLG